VQINCYKECKSGDNAYNDLRYQIKNLMRDAKNENKYVRVENGSISGATIGYVWKINDPLTIAFKLVRRQTYCYSCDADYRATGGNCVLNCGSGKFENPITETCDSCINNCDVCNDAETFEFSSTSIYSTPYGGWVDATWENVLTATGYEEAMGPLSVCPNTSRFNCEDSSNVCNTSYCDFHNSFCPEGYYLACFDRTDTAGYQQMASTDIQSCADGCSADTNCTRFEYNDGVWNLSKECWFSNDYPRSYDYYWLHNN